MSRSHRRSRWLLRLLPAAFREEHGAEIERVWRDEIREGRGRVWSRALVDTLRIAPGERAAFWCFGRGVAMLTVGVGAGVAGVSLLTEMLPIGRPAGGNSWTMTAAIAVVAVSSMLALWLPARRASGADPLEPLRPD